MAVNVIGGVLVGGEKLVLCVGGCGRSVVALGASRYLCGACSRLHMTEARKAAHAESARKRGILTVSQ